jgi:branched-chain amino acid transport system permease protein
LAGSTFGATVPPPHVFGLRFGPGDATALKVLGFHADGKQPSPWFGIFCLVVVLAAAILTLNLRRSGTGRVFLAVRSNERASAAAGVSLARTKVVAFSAGAFIAGIGGVLTGYSAGTVTANTFGSFPSITLLVFAYLGGISSVGGAFAGGLLISGGVAATALAIWFHVGSEFVLLLGGLGVVVTVVTNPEGIAGATRSGLADLRSRFGHGPATKTAIEEPDVSAA